MTAHPNGWRLWTYDDMSGGHVEPIDDLKEHIIDSETPCWCHPAIDDDGLVVHNSMDQRELYERAERAAS